MTEVPKIPYATIARFIGKPYGSVPKLTKEDIQTMIHQGIVAKDPRAKDYGEHQPAFDDTQAYINERNVALAAAGAPFRFRLQVYNTKSS